MFATGIENSYPVIAVRQQWRNILPLESFCIHSSVPHEHQ
jgi:hypothetical protein